MTKVTYHAPEGDAELVHMRGVRFIDGETVDLDEARHGELIDKLHGNPHFHVEGDRHASTDVAGLRAVHRGRGVYGVVDGDVVLDQIGPLSKDDADAFNAMSADEKASFVAAPPTP